MRHLLLHLLLAATLLRAGGLLAAPPAAEPMAVTLGDMTPGTVVARELAVRNTGRKELKVVDVQADCTCLQVTARPGPLRPGTSGVLRVEYRPEKPGRTRVQVIATLSDGSHRLFVLTGTVADTVSDTLLQAASVEAPAVLERLRAQPASLVVVDIREPGLHADAKIVPSRQIPLHQIRTMPDLKDRSLVLLNGPVAGDALRRELQTLQTAGFRDVKVLRGGMRAWQMAGGPVSGSDPVGYRQAWLAPASLPDLRPPAVLFVRLCPAVTAGKSATADRSGGASEPGLPGALAAEDLPWQSDARKMLQAIENLAARKQASVVVVATTQGDGYDQIEAAWQAGSRKTPLYYLKDGLQGARQTALLDQAASRRREVTLHGSVSVQSGISTRSGSGGCGTCPH